MTEPDTIIIEEGFNVLFSRLSAIKGECEPLKSEILKKDSLLFTRMGRKSSAFVKEVGLNMLKIGKQDTKGELYGADYYREKMIVLGRTDPASYRPDDPTKAVTDQFCVLSEKGKFYNLMYSSDGFLVDSFLQPFEPGEALDLYGYEIMVMLYRAMRDHLKDDEDLLMALGLTIEYISGKKNEHNPLK